MRPKLIEKLYQNMNKNLNRVAGLFFISSMLFLVKCSRDAESSIIFKEFIQFSSIIPNGNSRSDSLDNKKYLPLFKYDSIGNLAVIKSTLFGSLFGHYFKFKNGKLNAYSFIIDSVHNKLQITKDSIANKYEERGTPYIDYIKYISENSNKKYSFLFSKFPRRNLTVYVSFNGTDFSPVTLHESKIMPLLYETDIECNNNFNKIYLKIIASNLFFHIDGLEDRKAFAQTIIL